MANIEPGEEPLEEGEAMLRAKRRKPSALEGRRAAPEVMGRRRIPE